MVSDIHESRFSVSDLLTKAAGLIVHEMMEQEMTDFLGRQHDERTSREGVKRGSPERV